MTRFISMLTVAALLGAVACDASDASDGASSSAATSASGSGGATSATAGSGGAATSATTSTGMGGSTTSVGGAGGGGGAGIPAFKVVTFNTGTSSEIILFNEPPGYGNNNQQESSDHYGDGLAWLGAVDAATTFFTNTDADVVAFQEIFYSGDCPSVPSSAQDGFVCENWTAGAPTVAQVILGAGNYQVACNLGKPDKCVAVKKSFGSFVGCSDDLCLDGLDGAQIQDCGGGSRIGRGVISLAAGGTITVVNVHGTSGSSGSDRDCRVAQVEQVFVDLDGEPAANGNVNLVLGDFNVDPFRLDGADDSADRWRDFVGDGKDFHWVSSHEPASYAGILTLDYIVSDALDGTCVVPGITGGTQDVYAYEYFDHHPVVCDVAMP